MSAITRALKPFEVHSKGQYENTGTSQWGNRDIYPVLPEHQTYTSKAFWAYWATAGICISSYTLGSSMIGVGLTAGQACGAVLVGAAFAGLLGFLAGQAGRVHHLGFFMMCRAAFGLWGSYFAILLPLFESIIYFGIQSYYGGQAVVVILNSIFPQFLHLKNTLSASSGTTTSGLIGFFLYFVFYMPFIFVPPNKIQRFLYPNMLVICVTFAGILGWAINANGGPGNLVQPTIPLSKKNAAFTMLSAISSTAGAYTGGSVRISDWARFSKTKNAVVMPLLFAQPITVTIGALVGVLTTSAINHHYGQLIWNPLEMLQYVQALQYTPACRAGTFFAGVGLLTSQVFVNMTQNGVSSAMDITALLPRYIDIRRGGFVIVVIGIVIQPWRFLTQAATFLTVLSSFGVFLAPLCGIVFADFWFVRRQQWKIPDLYKEDGIFWFHGGWNWRALVAFFLSVWPSMPGFVTAVNGHPIAEGWTRIYQLSYFVGLILAIPIYILLNKLSPPPGQYDMETMDEYTDVIEGQSPAGSSLGGSEKPVEESKGKQATIVSALET